MVEAEGGNAVFVKADVSQEDDVRGLVEAAVKKFGRLDWACNNAGIAGVQTPIYEYDISEFDRLMATNCRGVFLGLRFQLPVMIDQGGGAIVNIASECSVKGAVANCAYTASKHAVQGLTKNAALSCATKGIRVNAVAPGIIRTGIFENYSAELQEQARLMIPSKRVGKPIEIGECVYWLLSDASRLVNGDMIMADDGWFIS